MGNKASNHKAETNSVRLGWWTGAEIADRKDLGYHESQRASAHAGYCGFSHVGGKTTISDSDAKEGQAMLAG